MGEILKLQEYEKTAYFITFLVAKHAVFRCNLIAFTLKSEPHHDVI